MAKEWDNKDRYHSSHGVPKPRMPLPRGKAVVRPMRFSGEGGQTGLDRRSDRPCPEGAVRPA
jgi:hypothetical protein